MTAGNFPADSNSAGSRIPFCRMPLPCLRNRTLRQYLHILLILALLTPGLPACANDKPQSLPAVSGFLQDGLRVIPILPSEADIDLTVYRGDYIKFQPDPSLGYLLLSIPDLNIRQTLPPDFHSAPFFKVTATGTFEFSLGPVKGSLTVIPYQEARYRELTTEQSMALITTDPPLILDVRTRQEYAAGHLPGAVHIPLHQLQKRSRELAQFQDRPILIYCATGNRSTVAAKILIDQGFEQVGNMRHGIVDWVRKKHPVVK
jgi:rhodanese-related sulfurtransferase